MKKIFYKHVFDKKNNEYVYVSVSGGVDSIAACHYMMTRNFKIKLFHFNHKCSPTNEDMEKKVRDFAHHFDLPIKVMKREEDYNSSSKEAALRNCRIKAMKSLNSSIVCAHHLDDCVESYLMNCLKGTPEYIPIPYKTKFKNTYNFIYRPFLLTEKDSFIDYIEEHKLKRFISEDLTNKDSNYCMRNWMRNNIIPSINSRYKGLKKVVRKKILDKYNFKES